jgi:hypothetical protein
MPDIFIANNKNEGASRVTSDHQMGDTSQDATSNHYRNVFSAFSLYPVGISFETQEDQEKIILMLRHHPIVNVGWILITIVLLGIPTFLGYLGVFSSFPSGFSLFVTLVIYLIALTYAIEGFLGWYYDVYFVTNFRIVDINFYNLISKKVSDAEVSKIQNTSYTTHGFLGAVFNYGNVFIQTAAKIPEFKFTSVPNPDKVAGILDDFMVKSEV